MTQDFRQEDVSKDYDTESVSSNPVHARARVFLPVLLLSFAFFLFPFLVLILFLFRLLETGLLKVNFFHDRAEQRSVKLEFLRTCFPDLQGRPSALNHHAKFFLAPFRLRRAKGIEVQKEAMVELDVSLASRDAQVFKFVADQENFAFAWFWLIRGGLLIT